MNKSVFNDLEALMKHEVFHYFGEISKIPRPSGQEQQISDYLLAWGRSLDLETVQDEVLNIVIKKPGTPGYENSPAVLLQAHMDMVCDKTPASGHDFTKDPIQIALEGDMIVSKGEETTLGVDNGIGMAYMMALLASSDVPHPPIEALFTTDEEDGFTGVTEISPHHFTARNLINLDHAVCDEILAGSCGGGGAKLKLPLEFDIAGEGYKSYTIKVSHMSGGHSGEDIHRGRGNAISLIARILIALRPVGVKLSGVSGGSGRTAIPRDASTVVMATDEQYEELKRVIEEKSKEFYIEYKVSAPNMEISLRPSTDEEATGRFVTDKSFLKVLQTLSLFPNGIVQMNGAMEGLVESSCNMGILQTEDDSLVLTAELRGGYSSTCDAIREKIVLLAEVVSGEVEFFAGHYPWEYKPDSKLRDLAVAVYKKETGKVLRPLVLHAGIECGVLSAKMPGIDAISIGPDSWFFHSVKERASVSAILESWSFLKSLLAAMK